MSKKIELKGEPRKETASQSRRAGFIPGVLYGHGVDTQSVQVDAKLFGKVFSQVGYTSLLNLAIGATTHDVLVRDVQFHPLKSTVTHIDFYQVRLDQKVKADVPLTFVGEAPAVKDLSGVLLKNRDTVEVEAFPQDLPHDIKVDISGLTNFEATLHVSNLQLPPGVEVLHEANEVIALVQAPRSEQEIEALAEEVKENVEAVETVEKPKEEEEVAEGAEGTAPEISAEKKE